MFIETHINDLMPGVHKFIKHLDHIKRMRDGDRIAPIHVSIWPTIRCNFKCSYCCCRDADRTQPDLSIEDYKRAIDVLAKYGTRAIEFSGGGEPLLWKSFNEAVEYAVNKGLKVSLITNGTYLYVTPVKTLKQLAWVRISYQSFDHAYSIDHERLAGVNHNGSHIVTNEAGSINNLMWLMVFCKDKNIPLRVATEKPSTEQFENKIKNIVASEGVFFSDKQHGIPHGCYMAWIRAAIDWRGNFLPCPAMHLSKEYKGEIPGEFILCHINDLDTWLDNNRVHDLGHRCSTCNCGKENNDFYHKVISRVMDEDFV